MTTNTTTTIRLRNKLTGLYYVEGKHFSGTESEATIIRRNSPDHLVIRYTYSAPGMEDNMAEVPVLEDIGSGEVRTEPMANGIEKVSRRVGPRPYYSAVGKQWTQPTWKLMGYRKDGKFSRTLRGLKAKLK